MELPIISNKPGGLKIVTANGSVRYAHNIQAEYRYDERLKVIQGFSRYFTSPYDPSPEQDAYSVLLWHLFKDFLSAYSFKWAAVRGYKDKPNKRHLYILRNSQGFIKVGITNNVKIRMFDLVYEWGGEWEILKIYYNLGAMEKQLHEKLASYTFPIRHRYTKRFSTECFIDCPEVLNTCLNLS